MAKWIAAEKTRAGLRHAVVCPNVTRRIKGVRPKQADSCWFARPCCLATSGANLYPPGVWFADVMTSLSGVMFVLFCFVFVFMLSLNPRPFVQSFFDMQAPRQQTYFSFLSFVYLEMSRFSEYFLYRCRFLFVWRVRRTFFAFGWCFPTL